MKKQKPEPAELVGGWVTSAILAFVFFRLLGKAVKAKLQEEKGQRESHHCEDIYKKLESIESKVDSGNRIQKFGIIYTIGVAVGILGLTYLPGTLEHWGTELGAFYFRNSFVLMGFGLVTCAYAMFSQRRSDKNRPKIS